MSGVITASMLKEIFARQRIRCPRSALLTDLATEMEMLRQGRAEADAIDEGKQDAATSAIAVLLATLPALIATNEHMAQSARLAGGGVEMATEQGARLGRLLAAVREAAAGGIGWRVSPRVTTWHDFAVPLAAQFKETMQAMDPTADIGLSNGGPVARFLTGVIPLISGEAPAAAAVMRHLQRERESGNTTRPPWADR